MAVGPEMTVIDARQVLCKNHLNVQTGLPLEANRLIISGDSLAADMVAAGILKEVYEPYDLGFTRDTFKYAAQLGIGVANPEKIVIKEVEV